MSYISGTTIRIFREKKKYTQKQLAERLAVSDKTISKWETEKGLPDVTMLEPLAREFQVSVAELLSGEQIINSNRAANVLHNHFYVCPLCKNVIHALGKGVYSCCGITLPPLEAEEINKTDKTHEICAEEIDGQYYVSLNHPMEKDHYISFFAYVTTNQLQFIKLYAEQNVEARFQICGHGIIYAYCNKHGLFRVKK